MSAPSNPELVGDALDLAVAAVGTPVAIASRLDGDYYVIIDLVDGFGTGIEVGGAYETTEMFCQLIQQSRRTEIIEDADTESRLADVRAREEFCLRSFLGVPLLVDGDLYGTLACCADRPRSFSEQDVQNANAVARLLEHAIACETSPTAEERVV